MCEERRWIKRRTIVATICCRHPQLLIDWSVRVHVCDSVISFVTLWWGFHEKSRSVPEEEILWTRRRRRESKSAPRNPWSLLTIASLARIQQSFESRITSTGSTSTLRTSSRRDCSTMFEWKVALHVHTEQNP